MQEPAAGAHVRPRRQALLDAAGGAFLFTLVLAVYVTTMYPSMGGEGDAIKWQYMCPRLGTGHPPGYPLYILAGWLASWLPVGSWAWRVNFLSGVCGAGAALCAYLVLRRLGTSLAGAAAIGAGLAFGSNMWSKAVVAEVYTLAALLPLAAAWKVVAWSRTRRDRDLFWAIGLLAAGLGNHLTVGMLAPAFLVYVLAIDWRTSIRPRVLGWGAALVALGLLPYSLILIRTWQGVPYIEARAENLHELWDVMRASRFSYQVFAFDWSTLLTVRVPRIFGMVAADLTVAGVCLVAVAVFAGGRRYWRELLLFGLGAAGLLGLTVNVDADVHGFVVPALAMVWPIAGIGVLALETSRAWRPLRRLGTLAALVAAVVLGVRNFGANDHRHRTIELRTMQAFFEQLPARARIVFDEYVANQYVQYMLLAEHAAAGRDIGVVQADADAIRAARAEGYTVYAFQGARDRLAAGGYQFEPIALYDRYVGDAASAVRSGWIVIVAATPDAVAHLAWRNPAAFAPLGVSAPLTRRDRYYVVAGAQGSRQPREARSDERAALAFGPDDRISDVGSTLPAGVVAEAGPRGAVIAQDGRTLAEAREGVAYGLFAPDGRFAHAATASFTHDLRLPLEQPVYRLSWQPHCVPIGDRAWHDVTDALRDGRWAVRVDNYRPAEATASIVLAADAPTGARVIRTAGPQGARVAVTPLDDRARLQALEKAGPAALAALRDAAHVDRIDVAVHDGGEAAAVHVSTGAPLRGAWARGVADRQAAPRVQVCSTPPPGTLAATPGGWALSLGPDGQEFLGFGWHGPERADGEPFRWTAAREAELAVPALQGAHGTLRLALEAMPYGGPTPAATLEAIQEGTSLGTRRLHGGWTAVEWQIAERQWRPDGNRIVLRTTVVGRPSDAGGSTDTRLLGVAVRRIRLLEAP